MNHATAIKQINEQLQNSNQSKPYHTVVRTVPHRTPLQSWLALVLKRAQYNLIPIKNVHTCMYGIPFISYFDLNFAESIESFG